MLCLIVNFDAGVEHEGDLSFSNRTAFLVDKASLLVHEFELSFEAWSSLNSHLVPVTKDVTCEGMWHVVLANPWHHFILKLFIAHINVPVEGILVVENLDIMQNIWCLAWNCDDHLESRYMLEKVVGSRDVLALKSLHSSFW